MLECTSIYRNVISADTPHGYLCRVSDVACMVASVLSGVEIPLQMICTVNCEPHKVIMSSSYYLKNASGCEIM